ncbi:hypothetical protein NXC14_PB00638 (plasmid) [Rhizobium sp. NXC14]|nr:hypothetical protein NXC14_PB00638 [Rhizobium sp. NXC14]
MWSVRIHGQVAVGRLGYRTDAGLAWETELIPVKGMHVSALIPTTDGRLFANGRVVMKYMEPPETESDWCRVADTLRECIG